MPLDRDPVHLWDMLNAAQGVVSSLAGKTLEDYRQTEDLRLATERRIEIIGEAARRVSTDFKAAHPEVPWRLIVDQRNVLIHAYDEIDENGSGSWWRRRSLVIEQLEELIEPV